MILTFYKIYIDININQSISVYPLIILYKQRDFSCLYNNNLLFSVTLLYYYIII